MVDTNRTFAVGYSTDHSRFDGGAPYLTDSSRAAFNNEGTSSETRASLRRACGPNRPIDPQTSPFMSKKGAAIATAPAKTSPRLIEKPSRRVFSNSSIVSRRPRVFRLSSSNLSRSAAPRNARIALPLAPRVMCPLSPTPREIARTCRLGHSITMFGSSFAGARRSLPFISHPRTKDPAYTACSPKGTMRFIGA